MLQNDKQPKTLYKWNGTIAGSIMSKEEGDIIKTRVISIGSRIETVILNFFKLLLLNSYYMPSTGLGRLRELFYIIFKTSL